MIIIHWLKWVVDGLELVIDDIYYCILLYYIYYNYIYYYIIIYLTDFELT